MTKEEFKKKYHGKSVKIESSIQFHFEDMTYKLRKIEEMCKLIGLETHQVPVSAPYLLITIVDKQQEFRTNTEPLTPMSEEEFLADFKEVRGELEFGVAKKLLADLKVEYGSITKLMNGSSQNMKQVSEEGFIQGYTSNDVSIWWHPMGKRLFFVRGEGVFELTDKSE